MFFFKRSKAKSSEPCGCSVPETKKQSLAKDSCCIFNLDDEIKRAQTVSSSEVEQNDG